MRKSSFFLLLGSCMVLGACSPKLDASGTEEQFYKSVQEVKQSLPENEQEKFVKSLTFLMSQQVLAGTTSLSGPAPLFPGQVEKNVQNAVHGKTAKQIIEEAKIYGLTN